MQSTSFPVSVCDEIDKYCCSFLWGDTETQKRIHIVAWDNIYKPKKDGGLGLRCSREFNKAFMMKCGWDMCHKRGALLVNIIRAKYHSGEDIIPLIEVNGKGSNLWLDIRNNW